MSFITANPDIDRLAGKAISSCISRSMQPPPVAPPTPELRFGEMAANPGYMIGEQVPGMVERHAFLAPFGRYMSSLGENDNSAALLGAVAGGLGGAGIGYMRGSNPLWWGLGGAAAGGLGSYLLSNTMSRHRQKKASWYAMDDDSGAEGSEAMMDIQAKIFQDYSASSEVKSELLRLLRSLDPRQLSQVHSMARSAMGAGAVYAIARYLMGMGVGTSALLGLLGGGMSAMMGGSPINAFGQRVDTGRNIFGQSRAV